MGKTGGTTLRPTGQDPDGQDRKGRFRKGQSGNPSGRPRRSGGARPAAPVSTFDILFEETMTVTHAGIAQERPLEEVLQFRTYQDALAGNRMARREVIRMILAREKALAKRDVKAGRGSVEVKTESSDPRNADAALLLLGIAERDASRETEYSKEPHLLLQRWAVQLALARRRGGHALTEAEVAEIRRCAAEPGKIRWPCGVAP